LTVKIMKKWLKFHKVGHPIDQLYVGICGSI